MMTRGSSMSRASVIDGRFTDKGLPILFVLRASLRYNFLIFTTFKRVS
jgi:hypothetical protein